MYVNRKMVPAEIIPGMGGWEGVLRRMVEEC
jgi:hypothetical protein